MSRVVAITGGTTGIGLGLAREFLKRGCRVGLCNLDSAQIENTITLLSEEFGQDRVIGSRCDVTMPEDIARFWDALIEAFDKVDIWISNAGLPGGQRALDEQSPDHIMQVVRVGLGGALLCARHVIPRMAETGGGWLWHTDGFGAQGATRKGMSVYGGAKAGVGYLRKALCKEVKGLNVKIGAFRPGLVLTAMMGDVRTITPEQKRIMNIIADPVETVTPYIADQILASTQDGTCIRWLTKRKMLWRVARAPFSKRDVFGPLESAS